MPVYRGDRPHCVQWNLVLHHGRIVTQVIFFTYANNTSHVKYWPTLPHSISLPACYSSIRQPTVSITKPSYRDLLEESARIVCSVVGSHLENTRVTWQVDGQPSREASQETVQKDASGSQEVRSSHPVLLAQWKKGTRFTCKVAGLCYEEVTREVTIQRAAETTEPSVAISRASLDVSLKSTMGLILVCDVSGFSPKEISISWRKNNLPLNTTLYDAGPVVPAGNTYSTYSLLKIGRDDAGGKGGSYSCIAHHSSSLEPFTATEKVSTDLLEPASPQVMAFHTSEEGERQKLICFATNFYPKNLDIQWSVQGTDLNCSSDPSALVALGDGKFQKSCSLVLSREEWSKPEIYTCTVNHSSTNTLVKKGLHSSGMVLSLNDKTAITMKLPPFEDLFINKSAPLTCLMPLENKTTNWTVSWTMDGERADPKAVSTKIFKESNHTSWIYGQLWVNLTEWKATVRFTCSIHNGLEETTEYFDRRNGTMKPPKVYLQHQSSKEDLNVTLLCMARDFYPGEIFVKWQEENKEVLLKGHDAHDLKCDREKQSCSLISILEVPKSKWSMGVSYVCLVAHVSSENIITRRASSYSDSWDCAVMGSALCDIRNESEDEYSELEEANTVWNKGSTFMILFLLALFYGGLVTFIKVK